MRTLHENIMALCKERGVSGSRMCLDLGLSKSTLSDLKHGRKKGISAATAQKMAAYLDVTIHQLMGEEGQNEKPTTQKDDRLSDLQREIMTIVQDAPEDLQKEFLNYLLFSKAQREK